MSRDSQQILLNRFCALGIQQKPPRSNLFLIEYQAGWNHQKLMKNTHLFCVLFKVSKELLIKILRYSCHFFYFVLFYTALAFTSANMIFYNFFRTSFSLIWKNVFVTNFSALFNKQNLLSTKFFLSILFKENIRKIFWGCLLLPVWNAIVNMRWMKCNHISCGLSRWML